MKIIQIDNKSVDIKISFLELKVLNNTIMEVYKGISLGEFKTRTGFDRQEVEQVRQLILSSLGDSHINQVPIKFSTNEIVILNNMFNEVCNGFAIEKFEEKIGVTKKEAQEILSIINGIGKKLIKLRVGNKGLNSTRFSQKNNKNNPIKKECFLQDTNYKFTLYLMELTRRQDGACFAATLDDIQSSQRLIKTSVKSIYFDILEELIFYLESITSLPQSSQESFSFYMSYLLEMKFISNKYNIENGDNLTLELSFTEARNKSKSEDIDAMIFPIKVSTESVSEFISSVRDFLQKCGYSSPEL